MAILIRNMKMPETCDDCPLLDWDLSYIKCGVVNRKFDINEEHFRESRAYDCPLVEVKEPHGELIDRDEVVELFKKYQSELFDYEDILEILQSAKAVVGIK